MVDPFEFIVRESVVTSSQEELLKSVPGWQEQQASASPSSSPSQAPLALSRLCGSGSSSDGEEREPALASAFCIQEPLQWASPEAGQDDSYNAAFESDRSRSLSPLPPLQVYGDLWASRLITQSQNDFGISHFRVCDLALAEAAPKKNPPQAAEVSSEQTFRQQENVHPLQGTNDQADISEPVALADAHKEVCVPLPTDNPNGLCSSIDHSKLCRETDVSDCNGHVQHIVEPMKAGHADPLPPSCDHTSRKKCRSVTVEEPAMKEAALSSRINTTADGAENLRKRKDEEGNGTFAQKLKEPNYYEQQHIQVASTANKGPLSKKQLGEDCVAGGSNTKCPLPFVVDKENSISTHRMENSTCGETEMAMDNAMMVGTSTPVFPESVMDVVMLVPETFPSTSPKDPDFLSLVMSTGVSLSLPYRDCSGCLISSKSVATYKGSFPSGLI